MLKTTEKKLFNLEELSYIDSMWDDSLVIEKSYLENRNYKSVNIHSNTSSRIIKKLVDWSNEYLPEKVTTYPDELILHRFLKGCFFSKHSDNNVTRHGPRRYLVGFTLNDGYSGGEFYTYYNGTQIIGKTPGSPYIMESNIEHEIAEVTEGVRKSALVFLYGKNFSSNQVI